MKNLFKNSVYAAAALVLALGAASCSDSDGDYTFADEREEALKNAAVDFVDNNVIPTYKALADGSIALQEDCEAMLEAFGWFTLSARRDEIARTAFDMSRDESLAPAVRSEALKTYNRLK